MWKPKTKKKHKHTHRKRQRERRKWFLYSPKYGNISSKQRLVWCWYNRSVLLKEIKLRKRRPHRSKKENSGLIEFKWNRKSQFRLKFKRFAFVHIKQEQTRILTQTHHILYRQFCLALLLSERSCHSRISSTFLTSCKRGKKQHIDNKGREKTASATATTKTITVIKRDVDCFQRTIWYWNLFNRHSTMKCSFMSMSTTEIAGFVWQENEGTREWKSVQMLNG